MSLEVVEGWIPDCVARIVARIQAVGLVENETTRATDLAGFFDCRMQALDGYGTAAPVHEAALRRRMNNELNFPPNFEGLVLGCIDADFCK